MENRYPTDNPAQGLNELINQKKRKLASVDKTKYAAYYNQTCAEIRELEYILEGLSTLRNFDYYVKIQKAIDTNQTTDCEVLIIHLPLTRSPKYSHAVLLDFTERLQHA